MPIKYAIKPKQSEIPSSELVVLFWRQGKIDLPVDERETIRKTLERRGAKGERAEQTAVQVCSDDGIKTFFMIGLGEKGDPDLDVLRRGMAASVQYAKQMAIREIAVIVHEDFKDGQEIGVTCAEGIGLGGYVFSRYQSSLEKAEKENSLKSVDIFLGDEYLASALSGLKTGRIFSEATNSARDLVNEPAERVRPLDLVKEAEKIAKKSKGRISMEFLNKKACEKIGMGAFLAVAQGSAHEPYFIHIKYRPKTASKTKMPVVALVGKGITFDSGGLSIKPADSMETMKIDMAGAATVLGVFSSLDKIEPKAEIHGFIAACENMPSGSAIKPGDVVTTQSGKTIEIRNTDAEGRLTLADAILQALKYSPDVLIDVATLTGACVVALGEDVAGLFSNDKKCAETFLAAAKKEGEQIWEMPLVEDYRPLIKSAIADLRNISLKRWGGAITAALFLEEFVDNHPWMHVDIAGPSYTEQQTNPVNPAGASGCGTRTILRYLKDQFGV